jgi:succinate dehydrogenase/fumarate reductase flavoprotein subunit
MLLFSWLLHLQALMPAAEAPASSIMGSHRLGGAAVADCPATGAASKTSTTAMTIAFRIVPTPPSLLPVSSDEGDHFL